MERRSIEAIVRALADANVRYLIVGGLVVVAHGHLRFTADIGLVLDLDEANLLGATDALAALGYRPRAPVALREFCSAARRAEWAREKGMTVFSLNSDQHPATEIDLFVEAPFDFDAAYRTATPKEIAPGLVATFVGLDDLIRLKERAGRPQDLDDVARLRERGAGRRPHLGARLGWPRARAARADGAAPAVGEDRVARGGAACGARARRASTAVAGRRFYWRLGARVAREDRARVLVHRRAAARFVS